MSTRERNSSETEIIEVLETTIENDPNQLLMNSIRNLKMIIGNFIEINKSLNSFILNIDVYLSDIGNRKNEKNYLDI